MSTTDHVVMFPLYGAPAGGDELRLFADAVIFNEDGRLLFLSAFGRDTAVQELLARLSLPAGDRLRLSNLWISRHGDAYEPLAARDLQKIMGRVPDSIFGKLVHLFLYDPVCAEPDRESRTASLLVPHGSDSTMPLWQLVRQVSHLPLLDHWRAPLLEQLTATGMIRPLESLGRLQGFGVELANGYEDLVSGLVQSGVLSAEASASQPAACLPATA